MPMPTLSPARVAGCFLLKSLFWCMITAMEFLKSIAFALMMAFTAFTTATLGFFHVPIAADKSAQSANNELPSLPPSSSPISVTSSPRASNQSIDAHINIASKLIRANTYFEITGSTNALATKTFAEINVAVVGPDYNGKDDWGTIGTLKWTVGSPFVVEISTADITASDVNGGNSWNASFNSYGLSSGNYMIFVYDAQHDERLITKQLITVTP
jgi:hypothetical protein